MKRPRSGDVAEGVQAGARGVRLEGVAGGEGVADEERATARRRDGLGRHLITSFRVRTGPRELVYSNPTGQSQRQVGSSHHFPG